MMPKKRPCAMRRGLKSEDSAETAVAAAPLIANTGVKGDPRPETTPGSPERRPRDQTTDSPMPVRKKVILVLLDGFGLGSDPAADAITRARKPYIDSLFATYPWTRINASSEDVGLPSGLMGNSEVGHMNIGAGRIVYQEITRINQSIRAGDFFEKPAFLGAVENVKR